MEKLDLYDVSVHEKDWKQFRKSASQDELLILGIGTKYRVISRRIISYLSALGIILSVVIGLMLFTLGDANTGLIILIVGYVLFSFLATKFIRYSDSLSQITRKLDAENKEILKKIFAVSPALSFFDALVQFIIMMITIPYQALLMAVGMIAPNFAIAKNGVLVAIPKGYDVGNLGAVGEFYACCSILDEWEGYRHEHAASPAEEGKSEKFDCYARDEYTYTDSHGYEQTVYSSDGKEFYDIGGHYVGSDGGKFTKKDKD